MTGQTSNCGAGKDNYDMLGGDCELPHDKTKPISANSYTDHRTHTQMWFITYPGRDWQFLVEFSFGVSFKNLISKNDLILQRAPFLLAI